MNQHNLLSFQGDGVLVKQHCKRSLSGHRIVVFFFVARKAEPELCADYVNTIAETMSIPIMGEVKHFADVFRWVMQMAQTRHITLLIDEFQEFINVNAGIFSEMQNIWDQYKSTAILFYPNSTL